MSLFSKRQKHDKKAEMIAMSEAEQKQAKERAEKFQAYFNEVLEVTVKHDMTIGELKLLTMTFTDQVEKVFGSRKVSDFMDKPKEAPQVSEKPEEPRTESNVQS